MITQQDFNETIESFKSTEERGMVYYRSKELIKNGFDVDAVIYLLAIWNVAYFSNVIKKGLFDYQKIEDTILKIKPIISDLSNQNIRTIDLNKRQNKRNL